MLYSVEMYDPDTKTWGWAEEDYNTLIEALYHVACMVEMDILQNEYIPNTKPSQWHTIRCKRLQGSLQNSLTNTWAIDTAIKSNNTEGRKP